MRGSINSSRLWKRLLSGAMAIVMLAGLLPGLPGLTTTAHAAADTKDAYGFDLEVPSTFDPNDKKNPYGSAAVTGHVNFNPVKELGIYESADNYQKNVALNIDRNNKFSTVVPPCNGKTDFYHRIESQLVGALAGSGNHQFFSTGYASKLQYVRGVAYDPTGSGKDDHIVYYGFGNNRNTVVAGSWRPGFITFKATEGQKGNNTIYYRGTSDKYEYMKHISPHEAAGYNALVAGDFDGTGKDTIMVYAPAKGELQLMEYRGGDVGVTPLGEIPIGKDQTIAGYFNKITLNAIQEGNTKEESIHRNTAMIHLAAGDLDGDGDEELVVTISLNDLDSGREDAIGGNSYGQGGSTASVVAVYDKKGGVWTMAYSAQLANVYDSQHKNTKSYQGWFLRSAASAIGDIDGDDAQEIVTVGTPADDKRHNDDDLWKTDVMVFTVIDFDKGKYSLRMVDNDARDQYKDAAGPARVPEGWYITNNGDGKFQDWAPTHSPYADNAPLSIGCVQLEGFGTTPYVFARGHIFKFANNNGKMQFTAAENQGSSRNPYSRNMDRYLNNMHYVSQPVIANFDGNKAGRQQVFFVVGNNGTDHWIVGLTFNPSKGSVMEGTGLSSSNWNTNVIGKNSAYSTFVALTAPDIDTDDGLLAQYKGKEYTWADPEIMAILEASPYFEALVDEYPDTAGSTTFGTGRASSSGKTESSSVRAGAYVSFSQEAGVFGIEAASAEMEASYEAEWSSDVEMTTEYEYTMDFETGRDYNQVLLLRTPVIVYNYEVTDPKGNKSEMNISTAQEALYCMIPLEKYNEIARALKKTEIGSDIVSAVPGQPKTYRDSTNGLNNPQTLSGNWINTGDGGNSVVTQSITKSNTTGITTSLTHSFDAKAGAGAFGFTVGVTGGYSQSKAQTTTNTESVTRSGTVSSVPAAYADAYGFQWKFMTWDAQIDGYTVPVLSYLVKNVQQAPSLPQNVDAVAETDSVTLTWEAGFSSAEKYEIYRYLDSNNTYNYVATVMGNAVDSEGKYTYEITGLTPGMSYSYSLRSVGGGKYSAYTEPLTVVTASQGGDLPNILQHPMDQSLRPGGRASFAVSATSGGGHTLTFQWQTRKAGQIAWENIRSANDRTLTIDNAEEKLNGNQYRCQVSQLSNSSETPVFVYSKPATLTVGKADSQTTVEVSGVGGTADYMKDEEGTAVITKTYAVTIDGATHSYYAYGTDNTYYYCLDDGEYYRLTGLSEGAADASGVVATTATGRTKLENLSGALVQTVGSATKLIARTDKLRSTVQATKTFDGVVYNVFTAQGVAVTVRDNESDTFSESTLTLYQKKNDTTDTAFYVEIGTYNAGTEGLDMSLKAVTKAERPTEETGTLTNLTYFDTPKPVWSDTQYETEGEDENAYTILTFGDGTPKIYKKADAYYTRTEGSAPTYNPLTLLSTTETGGVTTTPLGTVGDDGTISNQFDHSSDSEAERATIPTTKQELAPGQSVTLTAEVTEQDSGTPTGKVVFQIVNTTTGSEQKVEETLSNGTATATWKPTAAGVYQITATYQGNGDTRPSTSQPVTYYAYVNPDTTNGYRLNLAESLPYGEGITPSLVQWKEDGGKITETDQNIGAVTYTAHAPYQGNDPDQADADGYCKEAVPGWTRGSILVPGNYLIRAAWGEGNTNTASVKLTVTKRPVTVKAPTTPDALSADKVKDFRLADYLAKIEVTGEILDTDKGTYGEAAQGYPNLFRLTGGPQPSAGSYDIQVDYAANGEHATEEQKAAYADFMSKYLPTLQKNVVYVEANVVNVTYAAGPNGSLTAQMNGQSVVSGGAVSTGSQLIFTAVPNDGFHVSRWTINGAEVTKQTAGVTLIPEQNALIVGSVTTEMDIRVEFSNQTHTVNFSAGENGALTAATAEGAPISSGATVVGGSTVIFTAQPTTGFVVKSWTVNNEVKKNEDGSNYVGSTLTLENISKDTTVQVAFESSVDYTVTFTAVDSNTNETLTVGVDLSNVGLNAEGKAAKGSSVTLTATPNVGNAILEWQVQKGGSWETLASAQQSYTIQNLQSDMNIRVRVSRNATTYSVNFGVYAEDDLDTPAADAGTLSATVSGAAIQNGTALPNGSDVTFAYTEQNGCEFVRWEVSGQQGQESGTTYTVANLMNNTTVKAVVRKKPQVTISEISNGTVTVTANGQTITSGAYVYTGTELTVTAKPEKGYEVDERIEAAYTDGSGKTTDDKRYTISNVQADQNITVAWQELPTQEVTFSVVDTNGDTEGGENGSLTVSVDRKGMEGYKVDPFVSGGSVYEGSTVTFTAAADSGYRVKEWKVDGEVYTEGSSPFLDNVLTLPYEKLTGEVTVQFELGDARIVFTKPAHGKLTAVSAGVDFTSGGSSRADVVFTVVPDENYEVKAWTVNGKAVENETDNEFTYMPTDKNVTIAVELQGVALEITAEAGPGGTVSRLPEKVRYGEEVILTAIPNAGYAFGGWYRDDARIEDAGAKYTFTAAESASYEARFTPTADNTVTFSVNDETMGTITATANGTPITSGDSLTGGQKIVFTVTPKEGHRVKEWTGLPDGAQISADKTTATVPALSGGLNVTAELEVIPPRAITLQTPTGQGTITAQVDGVAVTSVPDGTVVTFTASPAPGWMLKEWTDGAAGKTAQSFTMEITKDVTIGAAFEGAVHYTVKYSVDGANGNVSAKANGSTDVLINTEVQLVANSSIVFTAVPATGATNYMVAKWEINGVEQDTLSNTLTIDALSGDIDVTVEFEEYEGFDIPADGIGYTIADVVRDPADTYTGAPTDEVRRGGDLTFMVKLAENYTTISRLVINGYDCITKSGTAENCEKVNAVKNSDGSYTVTISGVNGRITTDIKAHQLVVGTLTVPEAFNGNEALNTPEKIQSKLKAAVTGSKDGIVYYDIALKYFDTTVNKWVEVDKTNFPKNGVDVVLPYPTGTDSKDTFTIIHMLTTGENAGKTEQVNHERKADGLHFHVTSLSPFAVSWEKYEEPVTPPSHGGGGGGGGGAISADHAITVETAAHGTVTANKKTAEEGDTVTITAKPDEGYQVGKVTVTDKDGDSIKVIDKGNGKYTFTMPDGKVSVEVTFVPETREWVNPFVDVPDNAWYYDAVKYVNENGLMAGTSANTFAPDRTTTRGMIVTILYRLEGSPNIENEIWGYPFKDVDANAYYATAVYWARMNGIVAGYSDELFGPNDTITREQMATIQYRYAQYKGYDTTAKADLSRFTDTAQVGSYAVEAIHWANAEGLVNGTSDTTLSPKGSATRAQVASILTRFCQNIAK